MTPRSTSALPIAAALTLGLFACNTPPTAPTVSIEPGEAYTLDELTAVHGDATDKNGDALEYRFTWYKNGERQSERNESTVASAYTKKDEVWRVDVTAFDGKEQSEPASAEITVLNTPPEATVELAIENPTTEDRIRTITTKRDADLDPTTITYAWILNGSPQTFEGDTLPDTRTHKGEVWEVQVTPNDGDIDGEPATITFTIANTPPEVASAKINKSAPNKFDVLACTGEGYFDVDDDPVGYQVEWLVNGASYSTDLELELTELTRGDLIRCRLTAFDGEDTGNTVQSDPVTLQNSPPALTSVTIGPEDPLVSDTVTATLEGGVDPDGDAVSFVYEWKVNGVASGTAASLPSSRFKKDDRIQLTVYPTDGTATGEGVESNIVTAANNPPSIDDIRISPTSPYTDTVVKAEAFTSDSDGDTVSVVYEWYVNGSRVSVSTAELDGSTWFDKGDSIYFVAAPSDGTDVGDKVTSSTITAINSAPTAPDLILDPKLPDGTTDALCKVETASVDADGDSLTYTFAWTVNGGAPSSTTTTVYSGDTLPKGAYSDGDILICKVRVSDGTESSPEAIAGNLLGTKERPGLDCADILDERGSAETGTYWIDPDGSGGSAAFEVVCDMENDGGGWTLVYYVDADHFDGYYGVSTSRSTTAPDKLNSQKDLWHFGSDLDHSETLVGCTTQNDASTHWWSYSSTDPYNNWNESSYSVGYVYTAASSRSGSTTNATCFADYKGAPSYSYGFMVMENGSCGSCNTIVWGMYHYASSTGCNSTSSTYGTHTSKWRSNTVQYPICNGTQTSNGKFWIGVR